jgi:lipopolysaccharide heptosyltransferase III
VKPARRILVYRLGSLGDTVVALPALRLVERAFPEAERWVLTNFNVGSKAAPMASVLEGTGLVHGYLEYPVGLRDFAGFVRLRRAIRAFRPDVLVYLAAPRGRLKAWRDALFFRACGIRRLVGVPYRADQQAPLRLGNGMYEYQGARLIRCLEALGAARLDMPDAFDLALSEAEHRAAVAALGSLADGRPLLVASIGAKVDVKEWGDSNWAELLARLGRRLPGWGLGMLGVVDERSRSESMLANWPGGRVNLCGRVSVRESAALLTHAQVYLGHDSGPMHLAAAVGTPCVAVFSSRNLPGEWFPYGVQHRVLYHSVFCQGCRLDMCIAWDKMCIRSITVDQVESSVLELANQVRATKR